MVRFFWGGRPETPPYPDEPKRLGSCVPCHHAHPKRMLTEHQRYSSMASGLGQGWPRPCFGPRAGQASRLWLASHHTGPFSRSYQILQDWLAVPSRGWGLVANSSLVKRSKAASPLGGFSFLLNVQLTGTALFSSLYSQFVSLLHRARHGSIYSLVCCIRSLHRPVQRHRRPHSYPRSATTKWLHSRQY